MKAVIDKSIEGLIPLFFNKRHEDIKLLNDYISTKEYEEIQKVGHRVSGTAGNYGFLDLADIARSLEVAARAHDDKKLNELLTNFKSYVENVKIEFV